jgi:hypothetical protein
MGNAQQLVGPLSDMSLRRKRVQSAPPSALLDSLQLLLVGLNSNPYMSDHTAQLVFWFTHAFTDWTNDHPPPGNQTDEAALEFFEQNDDLVEQIAADPTLSDYVQGASPYMFDQIREVLVTSEYTARKRRLFALTRRRNRQSHRTKRARR